MAKEFHQGVGFCILLQEHSKHDLLKVMTTVVEDCQFVCITQADYYKILHEGEDALVREEDDNGELVKVSEVRRTDDGQRHAKVTLCIVLRPTSNLFSQVLLRASPTKLVDQLVEDTSSADPNYIEDFLLCHRLELYSTVPSILE